MKPLLYQGRDWISSRWSVAETLDTLDRIHDLCLEKDLHDSPGAAARRFFVLKTLHSLAETLTHQCAIAVADLIPTASATGGLTHLWNGRETARLLKELKANLFELSAEGSEKSFGATAFSAVKLKSILKKMDQ